MANPVLYLIPRPLESMNPGKMAAHVAHAATKFMCDVRTLIVPEFQGLYSEWDGGRGFGTKIVLYANEDQFWDFFHGTAGDEPNCMHGWVEDPTYPYEVTTEIKDLLDDTHTLPPKYNEKTGKWLCFREETTAMYFFGDADDPKFSAMMRQLDLHP